MIQNDIITNVSGKKEKIVYHYCSVETFISIISNSTLRASNIRKSNDYHEVISCIDIFQRAMRNACARYQTRYPEDEVFKKFIKDPDTEVYLDTDSLISSAIDNESCTYYCVCFSEIGDLLSQWRGYADDGRGVAIGFNEDLLKENTDYCHIKYAPIEYDLKSIREDLTNFIIHRFERERTEKQDELTCSDYDNVVFRVVNAMVYNAIFYKDASFSEECEQRLVFYPFGSIRNLNIPHKSRDIVSHQLYYDKMLDLVENSSFYGRLEVLPIKFTQRGKRISSYADIRFKNYLPYIIPEIILGPKCNLDDLDFKLFLSSCGIDLSYTQIKHSGSAYR